METWNTILDAWGPDAWMGLLMLWGPPLLAAAMTALLVFAIANGLRRVLREVFDRARLDTTVAAFIQTILRASLGVIGVLAVLDQLGVDTTSILASLGVVGLTLGFAAQNTLSNVISGLFIFWDRPFVIGDLVVIDGEYGRVETITLRSTRLVTPDGKMIAVPNTLVANGKVTSYTNFPHLRLDVEVTVAPSEDLTKVRDRLLAMVEGDPRYADTPGAAVVVTSLNADNVALELRVWLLDEQNHLGERVALRERIFRSLTEAGVDMPPLTVRMERGSVALAGC